MAEGTVVRECGLMMARPAGPAAAPERTHCGGRARRAGTRVRGTEGVREDHQGRQP
jgi:hypothetical protein